MSSRASERRRCTPPANHGAAPPLPPHQRHRAEELHYIWRAGTIIPIFWGMQNPQAAIEVTMIGWPGLSEADRLEALEELQAEADAEPEEEGDGALVLVLLTATRWFGRLELPRSEGELWSGPPLFLRLPLVVTITAKQRDALRSFALDCLSGIGETEPMESGIEDLSPDDLRQVLEMLDGAGGGAVDLRILRLFDARRVFERLRLRAGTALPATEITGLAAEAAERIRQAIDERSPVAAVATELQPEVRVQLEDRGDDDEFFERLYRRLGEDQKAIDHLGALPLLRPVDDEAIIHDSGGGRV